MTCSAIDPHGLIHRPLIPVAAAVAAGIAAGAMLPGYFGWAMGGMAVLALAILASFVRRRRAVVTPLLFCLLGGYLSIQPWTGAVLPDDHIAHAADSGRCRLEGTVVDTPRGRHGRWRFTLSASRLEDPQGIHSVRGLVTVTGRGNTLPAACGDRVSLEGRLRSIRNFSNPGGFDYRRHMALRGVHASIYARSGSLRRLAGCSVGGWRPLVLSIRQRCGAAMAEVLAGYPDDTLHLLQLLLIGEQAGISDDLRNAFNRAGLGHVLAISGLHVGMVAAVFFGVSRWLLAWIPALLNRGWTARGAALISLLAVGVYGVLAGLSPSTQRAMVMAALFMGRFWSGRQYDWFNTLAAAALILMLAHPPVVLSISFQLSFTAVLALVAGIRAFPAASGGGGQTLRRRLVGRLGAFMWISILAMMGTMPLVAHYFNQVSLVGPAVNLVAVPLVGLAILPLGLGGLVLDSLGTPMLPALLWKVSAAAMEAVRLLVHGVDAWTWAAVRCVTPSGVEILLYYGLVAVMLLWRRCARPMALLLAILALWAADGAYWAYQRFGRRDVRVTVIDVGQGSAALVELPGGDCVLVDGGGFSDNRSFDVGMRLIAPLLWRKKIATLDLVVLSHPNSDHLNGLLFILNHFNVREVWDNGEAVPTAGYRRWRRLIADKGIQRPRLAQICRRQTRCGVELSVLSPPADFLSRRPVDPWRDPNNNSLVLRVRYGAGSILFTGDIGLQTERELLRRYDPAELRSTVLVVPHHGSGGSSSRAFLDAVGADHAIISCAWMNRFGFPHAAVIRRLQALGSRIWTTAQCGAVQIVLAKGGVAVAPFLDPPVGGRGRGAAAETGAVSGPASSRLVNN